MAHKKQEVAYAMPRPVHEQGANNDENHNKLFLNTVLSLASQLLSLSFIKLPQRTGSEEGYGSEAGQC
jgi:hypothetical protein